MTQTLSAFTLKSDSPATLGRLLAALGRQQAVYYDEHKRFWVVLRHRDIQAAIHDPAVFSNAFYDRGPLSGTFLCEDGAGHLRQRRMFSRAFAAPVLRRAEQEIVTPAARRIVDDLAARPSVDLVGDFCYPLPIAVICALVGVSTDFVNESLEDISAIVRWNVGIDDPQAVAEGRQAQQRLMKLLQPIVEEQIRNPGASVLGELVRGQREDGAVQPEVLLKLALGLVMGGYETTAWMLACALSALLLNPEALARVRADRSLLMPAVEESMRWANSAFGVPRRPTRDVEIGGVRIPAGASVLLCTVAGHYDEDVYPRPEVFDIERRPQHMLFGGGTHFCVGAALARVEARVGLSLLLDRMPGLRLDPAHPPVFAIGPRESAMHGPEALIVLHEGMGLPLAA